MKLNRVKELLLKPFDERRSIKWFFRVLSGVGISVVSYFLFSLFFDTPIEYEIKKSTQKLEEQYTQLSQRYDSIHSVLDNVIKRDREIHKILFESEPYTSWTDDSTIINRRSKEDILAKNNKELGDELVDRTGQLYQRVYNVSAQLASLQKYVSDNRDLVNKIPAIQPIDNPDLNLIAASYGERIHPFYKSMKMHRGIDYSVPIGTAVFATADGVVTEVQARGQTTGTSILIRHDNTYQTYYANLYSTMVRPGQKVTRGDVIAFSGNSGLSFAPHLHYEVRYKGRTVDPIDYFFLEVDLKNQDRLRRIAASGMQSFD